jgi:N-acyl-D-aspartate/D-glutamate deacylase
MPDATWDVLLRRARVFDGGGGPPQTLDIAVRDGRIAARGVDLPPQAAARVIDVDGHWLMPGLLDIHTHLDLEVDLDPRLPEVVRHGTTTVLFGNCSLGTCFGHQRDGNGQDPIVDCFTRVENIPKSVLAKCVDAIDWDNSGDYMEHFKRLPLGPNVASFVPHSMLRVEAMGLEAAISRKPTEAELARMETLLEEAMQQGYLGLSTDGLPFHYLANEPHTDKRIPTQFASFGELRRLLKIVRRHDRVWQTTPILENRLTALLYFTLTSGLLFGRTLKVSALSAHGAGAGAARDAGLPRLREADEQPAVPGQPALPGPGNELPRLVRRHRQSPVRGAAVHRAADCPGIRRCRGPSRTDARSALGRGVPPRLAARTHRRRLGQLQGAPGSARSPGDTRPGAPGVRRGAGAGLGGGEFAAGLRAPAALLPG